MAALVLVRLRPRSMHRYPGEQSEAQSRNTIRVCIMSSAMLLWVTLDDLISSQVKINHRQTFPLSSPEINSNVVSCPCSRYFVWFQNQALWNRDEESLFCSSGDRKRVTWVFGCSCACPVAVWSWTLKWERTVTPGSDAAVLKMHVAVRTVVHRVVLVAFEIIATRTRGNPRCSPATNYCSLLNSGHHNIRESCRFVIWENWRRIPSLLPSLFIP